jgi:hypothetical protein
MINRSQKNYFSKDQSNSRAKLETIQLEKKFINAMIAIEGNYLKQRKLDFLLLSSNYIIIELFMKLSIKCNY